MHDVERIGRMRKQLGLTQKRLAAMSGVSQSLIAKIESGRIDPAYSKVVQIISALEAEQNKGKRTAGEVMTSDIISVAPSDHLGRAAGLMRLKGISQLPVLESGRCVGSLSEGRLVEFMADGKGSMKATRVGEVMAESFPVIPSSSIVDVAVGMLRHYPALLVEKNGRLSGIITKADLLKAM